MSHAYNWRKHRIKQERYESPWKRRSNVICDFSAQLEKLYISTLQDPTKFEAEETKDCAAVERKLICVNS